MPHTPCCSLCTSLRRKLYQECPLSYLIKLWEDEQVSEIIQIYFEHLATLQVSTLHDKITLAEDCSLHCAAQIKLVIGKFWHRK